MSLTKAVSSSFGFREEMKRRGGASAFRCYQCAACSGVCGLASGGAPFPRRQMLWAQWGQEQRIASDAAVWLCHQCNDCTSRCPRDAKPGDILQTLRALAIEKMAVPGFMGRLVGRAGATWPLLVGLPMLFWIAVIFAVNGFNAPEPRVINGVETIAWGDFVPHSIIYATYVPVALFVVIAIWISADRFWKRLGAGTARSGSFIASFAPVALEILMHRRFGLCDAAGARKTGHLLFFWGFVGAAITTAFIAIAMYGFGVELPVRLSNWMKMLGNASAVLLVIGGGILVVNRFASKQSVGASTAFDTFFLSIAVLTGLTGALTELGRLYVDPAIAVWFYVAHLSLILCLFATFPYCKFAHMVYRTLAMTHERMISEEEKRKEDVDEQACQPAR